MTMPTMSERNKTIALIGGVGAVLLILAALGYALIAGRPVDAFMPTLIGFATPTIVSLLTASGVRQQTADVQRELASVHDKVNGNYTTMEQRNAELTAYLANSTNTATMPLPVTQPAQGRHHR